MKKVLLLAMLTMFLGAGIQNAVAQSLSVSGKVTYADDGSPVIGATVVVVESATATLTDVNGMYQITVPASVQNKELRVTYAGLETQIKPVTSNGEVINFEMLTAATDIESVIVTGYGSARKVGTIVGSVEQVTSKELENRPSSSVMDALQGKVAGLQIYTSTGEPSEQQTIRLHGVGSLTSGTTPLFILDGIVVSQGTIQAMNPNDFESVTVLKDASATSIYGSRAANGVIYYTTKRGKGGEAQINVRGQYGVSTQADTRFYDAMMDTPQLWAFQKELGAATDADIAAWTAEGFNQTTDWYRYALKEWAPMFQGDLSITGGNDKTKYYVSAGIYNQEGSAPSSYYNKMNFRTNVESKVKDWLTIGANVQLMYTESSSNDFFSTNSLLGGLIYLINPMYPTYNPETGEDYWDQVIPGYGGYNPAYVASVRPHVSKNYGTASSMYMTFEPIENLKITSRGGLEYSFIDFDSSLSPLFAGSPNNGSLSRSATQNLTSTITNTVEYAFDINEEHSMTVLAGQEGVGYDYTFFSGSAEAIEDADLLQLQFGDQATYEVNSSRQAYRYLSFFGKVDYAWGDKLYVDATIRNDQSSRFGPNNQNATFWAAGARWNFKSTLLQDNETITDLAAKVSYGTQGNSSIGNYAWQGLYGEVDKYNGAPAWGVGTPLNPDLTWETQTKLTVSANISLWNRLNINVEYYNRETQDMLMEVPLPGTSGFGSIMQNVGGLRNEGIDFAVDYAILRARDYDLSVGFNINYNNQVITSLFNDQNHWTLPSTGITYVVGQAPSYYYPLWAGVNPQTGKQEWYLTGDDFTETTKEATTAEFNEEALLQNTGKPLYAPIAGGFNIAGRWKGFTLSADFAFALDKWLINNDRFFTQNPNIFISQDMNQDVAVTEYWKEPGDVTEFPNWLDGSQVMQFDSHLLENASFLRLKNLTLGYTLPSNLFKGQDVINGVRVYGTARNLLTITEYTGVDPEVDANLSLGSNPNTKQFVFGVEIIF